MTLPHSRRFDLIPPVVATGLLLLAYALVGPWGNYPLNDDWMYAHVTQTFVATGRYWLDVQFAPSLIGQSLLVLPAILLFGFSHWVLRAVTMAMALLGLWCADWLLRVARVNPWTRGVALAALALNPLYLYFSTTFMTEIYGYVPAFLAAAIWFWDRARGEGRGRVALIGWIPGVSVACLLGAAFWIRQFVVLAYPALLVATLGCTLRARAFAHLKASWLRLLVVTAVLLAWIVGYLLWAKLPGHASHPFESGLEILKHLDPENWKTQPGTFVLYMSAFLAPLLLSVNWRRARWGGGVLVVALLALVFVARWRFAQTSGSDFGERTLRHRHFPYLGNVLFNAGIGPMNTSELYWLDLPPPLHWSAGVWTAIEWAAMGMALAWAPAWSIGRRLLRSNRAGGEVALFGAAFALGSFLTSVAVADPWVHDRYYFPGFLGLWLFCAVVAGSGEDAASAEPNKVLRALRFALPLVGGGLVAFYAVGGVHDQFRWNDARWGVVRELMDSGVSPATIEGGYEVDGWLRYGLPPQPTPRDCIGPCHCSMAWSWGCFDDSRRVDFYPLPGYRVVKAIQPTYWLAAGPPLLWMERT